MSITLFLYENRSGGENHHIVRFEVRRVLTKHHKRLWYIWCSILVLPKMTIITSNNITSNHNNLKL